ncbi:MAG: sodium-dependent transporter [Chitinispirillaceae bacterium]
MPAQRENWGSKLGVILAVAGSAVGLGNFLRFPVKAASYGGGTFLIPYFISFLLLGIPLAWMEWTLGRYGGKYSHGSAPGILNAVVRKPWAKYVGSIGVFGPLLIFFYYTFIESWLLGFTWYSLNGQLMEVVRAGTISEFFGDYITLKTTIFGSFPAAFFFFIITFILNFAVITLGVRRGIEIVSEILMPLIVILGLVLLVRVLTLPDIGKGLGFMWNPDFSRLFEPRVWLEASGQMFFTLSLGIGAILTYASYVKKNQDVALSSLSACAANEFTEVILGGTIVIPMSIVIFGAANIKTIAEMGTFGLGFNTMPVIFGHMPLSSVFQTIWFSLLFFAGLTSSISIIQPSISFFEDELGCRRRGSVAITASISLVMSLVAVFGVSAGAVDEMDFWGGTMLLVLFGTVEAVVFSWIFGAEKGWKELMNGAHIRIPRFFKFVLKYVTPTYLIIILVAWLVTDGWNVISLAGISPDEEVSFLWWTGKKVHFITFIRALLFLILVGLNMVIYFAWKYRKLDQKSADKPQKEAVR